MYNNHVVIIKLLLRKQNTKSLVWTNFGLEADNKSVLLPGKEDKPTLYV